MHHAGADYEFLDEDSFRTLSESRFQIDVRRLAYGIDLGGRRIGLTRRAACFEVENLKGKKERLRSGEDRSRWGHPAAIWGTDWMNSLSPAMRRAYESTERTTLSPSYYPATGPLCWTGDAPFL